MKNKIKKPNGIGGWLILPTIGLFLSAAIYLFSFILFGAAILLDVANISDMYLFFTSIVMFCLVIYLIVIEFKKKKLFPKLAIFTLWLGVILAVISGLIDGDFYGVTQQTVGAILWSSYFKVSKRVKNTFTK